MNKLIKRGMVFILVFIAIGELAIRASDAVKGNNFFSNEFRDKLVIKNKNPIVPFTIFGPVYYVEKNGVKYISSSHNELYPLKKTANTFRIICLGGSTTESPFAYKDYKIHYPLVLQRLLREAHSNKNIEVINVSFSAYSTAHLLVLLLLDVISWEPDLVIICENINDMDATYRNDLKFDYSNKYGSRPFMPDFYDNYTTLNVLFRWSSFYWFLEKRITIYSEKSRPKKEIPKTSYGKTPPKISQDIFRRNLLNFYYITSKWNIPLLYSTQPLNSITGSFGYLVWDDAMKNVKVPLDSERKSHHEFFNKIIKEVALNTNSYFLDNDSLLGGEPKYFMDEVHYSKIGIEKLAGNYRDYIISKNIIK